MYQELGVGWNVKGKAQIEKDDDGASFYLPEEGDKVENVVVDLKSGTIIGKTKGVHCADKAHCSAAEMTNQVVWSSSRLFMVQMAQAKRFETLFAEIYGIPEMQSVTAGTDILDAVKQAMVAKMGGKLKAEHINLSLHDLLIAERGTSTILSVGAQAIFSDEEGPDFTVTFKITPGTDGAAPKLTVQNLVSHE